MTNPGFYDQFYEFDTSWGNEERSAAEEERIRVTVSAIPEGCSSVLDVGCGDGRITSRLVSKCETVCGLDRYKSPLRFFNGQKVLGSVECLPFADSTFDLVLCTEVIEHLPYHAYRKSLAELQRVAGKHIIITVPNSEELRKKSIACPHCGCISDPDRHLRSFDQESLSRLFDKFSMVKFRYCGPATKTREYPAFLVAVARFLGVVPGSVPPSISPAFICPQCGYSPPTSRETGEATRSQERILGPVRLFRLLARPFLLSRRREGVWLLALYQSNVLSEHASADAKRCFTSLPV